jgi:hypothetical protein
LNVAGKSILINLVLSSLPFFQCSALLAPKLVLERIASKIRTFLREGGKNETKKFHLIICSIIHSPKYQGGLFIKDLALMNIAMGAKIIWRLITRPLEWWKKPLHIFFFT